MMTATADEAAWCSRSRPACDQDGAAGSRSEGRLGHARGARRRARPQNSDADLVPSVGSGSRPELMDDVPRGG